MKSYSVNLKQMWREMYVVNNVSQSFFCLFFPSCCSPPCLPTPLPPHLPPSSVPPSSTGDFTQGLMHSTTD